MWRCTGGTAGGSSEVRGLPKAVAAACGPSAATPGEAYASSIGTITLRVRCRFVLHLLHRRHDASCQTCRPNGRCASSRSLSVPQRGKSAARAWELNQQVFHNSLALRAYTQTTLLSKAPCGTVVAVICMLLETQGPPEARFEGAIRGVRPAPGV